MKYNKRKRLFLVLAIIWMIMIFGFSSRNGDLSGEDSGRVGRLVGEWFVPGRSGQVRDVLIDSCGAFIGVMLVTWMISRREKKVQNDVLRKEKYQKDEEEKMNELYEAIEKKIKDAGYPRKISGADVYNDICDQIDGKENGTYILLSKFEDDVVFEYHITIQDEDFNLGILTMKTPEGVFEADFDAE